LSPLTAADGVDYLKMQARRFRFKLSQRASSCSDCVRLYCHRTDLRKETKTTKTDCPVKLHLIKRERRYDIHLDPDLRYNHPLLRHPGQELPSDSGEII
jgi:hypothetical protein